MFCEESLRKSNKCDLELFRKGSVHECEHFSGQKKKKEQSSLAKANWSGVVNFSCIQMSLVMSMLFTLYFSND